MSFSQTKEKKKRDERTIEDQAFCDGGFHACLRCDDRSRFYSQRFDIDGMPANGTRQDGNPEKPHFLLSPHVRGALRGLGRANVRHGLTDKATDHDHGAIKPSSHDRTATLDPTPW